MSLRLALIAALAAALVGAAAWFYNKGSESAKIETERQNNVAGSKSESARSAYDRCVDPLVGGVYDFATGKCGRPSTRGRN